MMRTEAEVRHAILILGVALRGTTGEDLEDPETQRVVTEILKQLNVLAWIIGEKMPCAESVSGGEFGALIEAMEEVWGEECNG